MNRIRQSLCACVLISTSSVIALADEAPEMVIKDNSFLIEEAYNQEAGVIQHVFTFNHFSGPTSEWSFSFTEEFPLGGQSHQGSITIPALSTDAYDQLGVGDILINYRYQLRSGEDGVAISPRLSLLLPSGDESRGHGDGVVGFQANLPVSNRLSSQLVLHLNAGATILPGVTDPGVTLTRTVTSYNIGGSLIWLSTSTANLMLEVTHGILGYIEEGRGQVAHAHETIVSPGARFAINQGSLQIVPGIGIPIRMTERDTNVGIFGYLSFEHPL